MNSSTWVELIRRIPEAQHDNLVAITCTGAEIMVQKILVLENDYMIFRGRPAGSTEAPRILLMPFDQVNHLAFNKPLQEAEVKTMFGSGTGAVMDSPPTAAAEIPVAEAPAASFSRRGPVRARKNCATLQIHPPGPSARALVKRLKAVQQYPENVQAPATNSSAPSPSRGGCRDLLHQRR